jgi:hypothetical protein
MQLMSCQVHATCVAAVTHPDGHWWNVCALVDCAKTALIKGKTNDEEYHMD